MNWELLKPRNLIVVLIFGVAALWAVKKFANVHVAGAPVNPRREDDTINYGD